MDAAVNLTVNQYVSIDPATVSGCSVFPATTAVAAEYLVVPQLTSGVPGQTAGFRLNGDTVLPAPSAPIQPSAELGIAEQFHMFLRLGDEHRSWGFAPEPGAGAAGGPRLQPSATASPPGMNSLRTFQVCAKTDCSRFDRVGARVRALKTKVAIYVDTLAPAGGLDSTALDGIATTFNQRLYAIDTAAFGRESDIDSNTVVLVLMEVFYSIVADPAGTLSCSHSTADVENFVPVTFIHEFQHMISFGQHVIARGGNGEVLWLNEGFSHYAEELGGRSYALSPDATVTDCTIGTTECRFYGGDLLNAYEYLDSTSRHFLLPTAGIGTLAERGAAWLFVRYVVDKYAAGNTSADWNTLTHSLVSTSLTGAENIATVTGAPFSTVVSRWALANYVTDRGGAPPELQYDSWRLHAVYSSLHTQRPNTFQSIYPLVPTLSQGRNFILSGALRAGSGYYHLAEQPYGDPGFTLSFTAPNGAPIDPATMPRLNVIRLQ